MKKINKYIKGLRMRPLTTAKNDVLSAIDKEREEIGTLFGSWIL